jgi:hypothetical protein
MEPTLVLLDSLPMLKWSFQTLLILIFSSIHALARPTTPASTYTVITPTCGWR